MTPEFDVICVSACADQAVMLQPLKAGTRVTLVSNTEPFPPMASCGVNIPGWESYRVLCVGENAGWVRATNAGLSLATAPHVVLCNDDIEVCTEGWLEKPRRPFLDRTRMIAAVGPRSTPNQGPQGQMEDRGWYELAEDEHDGYGGEYDPDHEWGIGKWPLSFFCVMLSQEAIRDVGLLDLNLADGYGGDDDDWQRRAWEKGWRFAYQPEVFVKHEGNATFRERKAELQPRNLEYLRAKWGRG